MTVRVSQVFAKLADTMARHGGASKSATALLTERGFRPSVARNAFWAFRSLGADRIRILTKVMERMADTGVSASRIYQIAAPVLNSTPSTLEAAAPLIPAQFMPLSKRRMQGQETPTVVELLPSKQAETVEAILTRFRKEGVSISAEAPVNGPAVAGSVAAAAEDALLADLALLGTASIPGFEAEELFRQLGALVRCGMAGADIRVELEQIRSENERLRQEVEELRQLLVVAEQEADARIAAAKAQLEERRKVMEEEYEAFRTVVDEFISLGNVQQISNLGELRTKLVYTLDKFGNVIKVSRVVA